MYLLKINILLFLSLLFIPGCFVRNIPETTPKPVVIWHGMGDTWIGPLNLKRTIQNEIPGIYVKSLKIGKTIAHDMANGFLLEADKQIQIACDKIAKNEKLKNGFNAIGLSQGAQLLRAVAQKCPQVHMHNLISLGGQHQGVYGFPGCGKLCGVTNKQINKIIYDSWVQHRLLQASYWHDPLHEDKYREHSIFIADINNEKNISIDYIQNLQKLNKLVLVRFNNDTTVKPAASQWFGFFAPGQDKEVVDFDQLRTYTRLGLDQMYKNNQIDFLSKNGGHLQIGTEWFIENIINKYLKP